jgi:branched-chain amino acid transport system substrate-binding protein
LGAAESNNADYRSFASRFQTAHGGPPDDTAVLTYDATRLLLAAIRRAGPNRARLREALLQMSPWAGLAGEIRFDGTGQNTRSNLCLGTIRHGAITCLPMGSRSNLTITNTTQL